MNIKVYTYDDPRNWREHSQYDQIKNYINICATKNMADGISEAYQNTESDEFHFVFTIREVMDKLLRNWNSEETQLQQYLTLSRIIHRCSSKNSLLKEAFRNNLSDVLETIRFLTYTGVKPNDLSGICETEKEELFQQLWFELEEEDVSYQSIQKQLRRGWNATKVMESLEGLVEHKNKVNKTKFILDKRIRTIVLHGFYFITPEQQIFLQLIRKAGYELIFFNFYDQRFPDTFDFTRAFISEQFQWNDEWLIESNRTVKPKTATLGTSFLSAFEGSEVSKQESKKEIVRYDSFFEFLNEVIVPTYPIGSTSENEDVQIIATNADMLNDILVQYYPDHFAEKRNFLHYPIGKFLSNIHQMLDKKTFVISEDILISTFSSGWLYNPLTKKNARDYTYELKKLLPFFGNCQDTKSWLLRFEDLLTYYDQVLPAFEEPGDNRVVRSVRSPFAKIGHFSLTKRQVEDVFYFVKQLVFISEELFDVQSEDTSISEHFKKLFEVIEKYNPTKHSRLHDKETEIIEKLNKKLENIQDDNFFLYEDIGEAINLYLSGKFSKEERALIKPFIELDGEVFKQKASVFYITGLDEKGLPLDEFSTPWPIQEETFEKLSLRHEVLELNILRNKSVKQISRYLFFMALEFLNNKQLEFSWMRNFLDRKDLQPAIYVHQLGLKIKDYQDNSHRETSIRIPNPVDFNNLDSLPIEDALINLAFNDFMIEYNQCPRRFYYSYIVSPSPVYNDDFIHQFLFTELIRLVKRNTTLDNDKVIQSVSDLFPQWTQYKKESNGLTYINSAGNQEKVEAVTENVNVSEARKNFQLPGMTNKKRQELIQKTGYNIDVLQDSMKKLVTNNTSIFPAEPGFHCRFCPHIDSCFDAAFSIDKE
jgi:hypothetical protein